MQSGKTDAVSTRKVTTHDLSRLWYTICLDTANKCRIVIDFSSPSVDSPAVILQWIVPEEIGEERVMVDHVYAQRLIRHNADKISFVQLFELLIAGREEFYKAMPLWEHNSPDPEQS